MKRWHISIMPLAAALALAACERSAQEDLPVVPLALETPCDVAAGCVASAQDVSLQFRFGPELRALESFPVQAQVQSAHRMDAVTVAFSMPDMDMGANRYQLISDGAERWLGNVTLPVCTSGRSDWVARFELVGGRRRFVVEAPFVLSH